MQIHLNADHPIETREGVEHHLQTVVSSALQRFRDQVTRVEAHLDDREGHSKTSPDHVRLVLEARLAGLPPISVTDSAATVHQAITGAAGKLERAVESALGRHAALRRTHEKVVPTLALEPDADAAP